MSEPKNLIENTIPVILAGGSGTRLWPMSRGTLPKQFLKLDGKQSFLQHTISRCVDLFAERPWIITADKHRFLVDEELEKMGLDDVTLLLEPTGRDTAAATFLVALAAAERAPGKAVFLQPSDHLIPNLDAFADTARAAVSAAENDAIVTIGITPGHAETGYGYIERGSEVSKGVARVAAFREKPDAKTAQAYLDGGEHLWNAGMFVFQPDRMIAEAEAYSAPIMEATRAAFKEPSESTAHVYSPSFDSYGRIPALSIDYAVMEKTKEALVVEGGFKWSDIGSWDSAWDVLDKDAEGNVDDGNTLLSKTTNSYVHSSGPKVVTHDVDDLIVVADDDAVLVSSKKGTSEIKTLVNALIANGEETLVKEHKTVYRPWGGYTSLAKQDRFQVKRLFVKPGKRLSLQKHHHRSEHWVVVTGCAEITINDEVKTVNENESVYITSGDVHRLANPGKILLEVIEVQIGSYLGEDDIIRIQDDFKRAAVPEKD